MSTYVPIQAITLSSATASVTFTGIPQNFTDLVLVANARSTGTSGTSEAMNMRMNSDTSSLYSVTRLSGTGSSAFSNRGSNATATEVSRLSPSTGSYNAFDATVIQFLNYASTSVNKTVLCRGSSMNEDVPVTATVSLYKSTNAITSITLFPAVAPSFASGSTFTLYGIGSGAPKAFGGDEVRTDGTYWYHIFRSSGRFEPVESLTNVDYLVVAGGGGGGRGDTVNNNSGGGGGAGGLRCTVTATGGGGSLESKLSLTANTVYTVTVGAGGANAGSTAVRGTNGSNSVFGSITSTGGGGGGSNNISPWDGSAGGSGGGASQGAFPPYTLGNAGAGTASQGYAGGNSANSSAGGGGGGAGQLGQNGNGGTNTGGAGGAGVATSITGSSVTYAGGGGGNGVTGGAAGSGGGGAGTYNTTAGSGTANTGGGGGASSTTSGSGGSGIVIVRYLA